MGWEMRISTEIAVYLGNVWDRPSLIGNVNRKSRVADRSVSVPMTLKGGSRRVNFFKADLFNNARTEWPRTTKFGRITHVGEGISIGSVWVTPLPQGGGAPALPNFGFRLFLHTPFIAQRCQPIVPPVSPKRFSPNRLSPNRPYTLTWVSLASHPKRAEFQFWGFSCIEHVYSPTRQKDRENIYNRQWRSTHTNYK